LLFLLCLKPTAHSCFTIHATCAMQPARHAPALCSSGRERSAQHSSPWPAHASHGMLNEQGKCLCSCSGSPGRSMQRYTQAHGRRSCFRRQSRCPIGRS
jgi:hypothetical protein